MTQTTLKIAYILQIFPSTTQTFVYREVSALRRHGVTVNTFSIYRPDAAEISAEAVPFLDETAYAFPINWTFLILAHLKYFLSRPLCYLQTLVYVVTRPDESWRSRRRTLVHFLYGLSIVRAIEQTQPQHIHAHFGWSASTIALIAHRLLDIPFSVTFHSFHDRRAYPERLLPKEKIRCAQFVITISEYHRQFLRTFLPQDDQGDKIHVIHHGLDPGIFTPGPDSQRKSAEYMIVGVGQLIACKGFDILIEACRCLTDRYVAATCHILGEGPERHRLEELISHLDLQDRVFLPGRVDQIELRATLNEATVFCLPCLKDEHGRQDGLPVVLTEAMAMQLPVVSTTITAIPELVKHNTNGLLVPPQDPIALADALQLLASDEELRLRLGQAGRETVVEHFNIARSAEQLVQVFEAYGTDSWTACVRG